MRDIDLYVSNQLSGVVLEFDGTTGSPLGVFASGLDLPTFLLFTPEPGTALLVGIGLVGLAGGARVRRGA